jgi:hypothetical protein
LISFATLLSCGKNHTNSKDFEINEVDSTVIDDAFKLKQMELVSAKTIENDSNKTNDIADENSNAEIKLINSPSKGSKLDKKTIFHILFQGQNKFDSQRRLIRNVNRNDTTIQLRTAVQKTYYYEKAGQLNAVVILFSYDYSNGFKMDCHSCYNDMEIACFQYANGEWLNTKFLENWKRANESWEDGPEISVEKYMNQYSLVLRSNYGTCDFEPRYEFYNLESLEPVNR